MLLAIDPGKEGLALALFDGNTFVGGSVFRAPKGARLGVQCLELWREVRHWWQTCDACPSETEASHVAIEEMVYYPSSASAQASAQNAACLHLQAIGAYIAGHFACPVTYYPARVWKSQLPKAISHERIKGRLTPSELETLRVCCALFGKRSHNLLDALGIGHYHIQVCGPC